MNRKEQFDEARKAWLGVKSGLDVEWDNLRKVCKVHKLNGSKVVPELLPSIERYESYRKQRTINNEFVEPYCSFTVYINGRRWTREYPAAARRGNPPCRYCGKPSVACYIHNWHCDDSECRKKARGDD